MDRIRLDRDVSQWLGLVNTVMNFGVPLQVENFDPVASFSRMTQPHSALLLWDFREKERGGVKFFQMQTLVT